LHASWVNQIELWFALYTRRVLRHASHTSTAHLRERTEQFIRERNQTASPFKWTFRGSVAIRRCGIMFGAKTKSLPDETEPDASLSARV
jgi:hypothetical protein